jgi:hypothetical protein
MDDNMPADLWKHKRDQVRGNRELHLLSQERSPTRYPICIPRGSEIFVVSGNGFDRLALPESQVIYNWAEADSAWYRFALVDGRNALGSV